MSTYYHDPKVSRQEREEADVDLRDQVEQVRVDFPRAGYRMLLHHLKRKGIRIGERRLRRIIAKFEMQIRPHRQFVVTTDSNHDFEVYPNLIEEMALQDINQVWTADITYIRIANGFVYLAILMDLYSRKIIGWQISKRIDAGLVVDALKMAIVQRRPPRGVIHHSDRGAQYLCGEYTDLLREQGFHISCSRKANPYDNAWTESFMKTLKYDEVHMYGYSTYLDVIERLPQFIEEVYNKKRLHSSIGYLPPEEFEQSLKQRYEKSTDQPTLRL